MKKVLAGGRFNIIHPGHIYFLEKAKELGDYLVVVIASDKTVKNRKVYILFPAKIRKKSVQSLRFVDKVVIGYDISDQSGYVKILKDEKPDIIALGYDQKISVKELAKIALKAGIRCKIVRIGNLKGFKSKEILKNKSGYSSSDQSSSSSSSSS